MSEFFGELEPEESTADSRHTKEKSRRRKRLRTGITLFLITALIVAATVVAIPLVKGAFTKPEIPDYEGNGVETTTLITIPEGASGRSMANILFQADVVASERAFVDAFNDDPRSASIQAGTYELNQQMSGADAVAALLDPSSRAEVSVTIPEGFTQIQVEERIANVFEIPIEDVQAAAQDTKALGLPDEAKENLEGWLAPVTYTFAPDATPAEVLSAMIAHRVSELERLGAPRESWQRLITVASIVEREVNWEEYYGQVARVIENRLTDKAETHGLLQMDSTVNYGLGKVGGVPSAADLKKDTPFNTYIHPGLPPGPVSNPSFGVIEATMNPPEGDWLYFVTINLDSGETLFANSLEDHNRNVTKFREWVAENRD